MKEDGCRRATRDEHRALWETEETADVVDAFTASFGSGVTIVDKDGKFASWFMELPSHCCC